MQTAIAKASEIEYEKGKYRFHAIIVDKRNRTLSEASNSYLKSSPHMAVFAQNAGIPEKQFWHAECLAIHRIPRNSKPYKIIIARVNKNNEPLPAIPCPICLMVIKSKGIKVIEHTI